MGNEPVDEEGRTVRKWAPNAPAMNPYAAKDGDPEAMLRLHWLPLTTKTMTFASSCFKCYIELVGNPQKRLW